MGCRKNQATLTAAERTAFVNAVLALKAAPSLSGLAGRYDDFVQEHVDSMTGGNMWAHQRPAFLPWHREYLRRFELALQEHDPGVNVPYWDWTVDNLATSAIWNAGFMGGDGTNANNEVATGPFAHSTGNWDITVHDPDDGGFAFLRRQIGGFPGVSTLPTPDNVNNCLLEVPYDASPWDITVAGVFRNRLEGWTGLGSIHNRVHLWVGGNATGTMYFAASPNDPVFWLHHCNIDRLWAQWQREHPAEPYHPQGSVGDTGPVGHNLNDSMQPWGGTTTVASTFDHHAMGFWYDTDPPDVTLTTPSIGFVDVPEGIGGVGRETYRAAVFEVRSCAPVTLEIVAGPSGGFATTLLGTNVVVPAAHGDAPAIGRIWISYTSTTPGSVAAGSVTIAQQSSTEQWIIPLTANTIARPKAAVALALDRSGSMSSDAGDNTTKATKLKEAVEVFVDTMLEGDGLSIISYDDVVERLMDVTDVGPQPPAAGSGRAQASAILAGNALDPRNATAIGSALVEAQAALDDAQVIAVPPYQVRSIVVLTDGIENVPPMINTVSPGITVPTYAVGLGTQANISTDALDALAQGTGRYLLVTGTLSTDQRFRLSKFFLQILAGITNADIVLDPTGQLVFGPTQRIPFDIARPDYGFDAILTSPLAPVIDFRLEAPDGTIVDRVVPVGQGQFVGRRQVSYYRLPLPYGGPGHAMHAGRWHALLSLNEAAFRKLLQGDDKRRAEWLHELRDGAVGYNLVVHAYSSLRFEAASAPSRVRPGDAVVVTASLSEYDVPVEARASVWVDVSAPGGATRQVALVEVEPGAFRGEVTTQVPGLYSMRCRARGRTLAGTPFTRERSLTAMVGAAGRGGHDGEVAPGDGLIGWLDERDERLCRLFACLLGHGKGEVLGMDAEMLKKCLAEYCRPQRARMSREHALPQQPPSVSTAATASVNIDASGATLLLLQHQAVVRAVPLVGRLVEALPRPQPPAMEHHAGEPMFGLSDADLAAAGLPLRGEKQDMAGQHRKPGNKRGKAAANTRRKPKRRS